MRLVHYFNFNSISLIIEDACPLRVDVREQAEIFVVNPIYITITESKRLPVLNSCFWGDRVDL